MKAWLVNVVLTVLLLIVTGAAVGVVYFTHQADIQAQQTAKATQILLTNGKTQAALNAKTAAVAASKGEVVITHVEGQLSEILADSHENHALICSIASTVHVSNPTIVLDCAPAP